MGLIRKIIEALLGSNGFDPTEHEAEVCQLKEEQHRCYDEMHTNLDKLKDAFSRIDLESSSPEMPESPQPSREDAEE